MPSISTSTTYPDVSSDFLIDFPWFFPSCLPIFASEKWRQAQVSSATGGVLASTYGLGAGEATKPETSRFGDPKNDQQNGGLMVV